jgi:hypothetical protein
MDQHVRVICIDWHSSPVVVRFRWDLSVRIVDQDHIGAGASQCVRTSRGEVAHGRWPLRWCGRALPQAELLFHYFYYIGTGPDRSNHGLDLLP